MNTHFDTRSCCPGCQSEHFTELYATPYSEPPISTYLAEFYRPFGEVDRSKLADAEFSIVECQQCSLVFQKHIPNEALMHELYEVWIDPEKVSKMEEEGYNVDYHWKDADEILALLAYFNQPPRALRFFDFGMGWAKWCQMAQAFSIQAYGAELSETRIAHAQSKGIEVVDWQGIPGQEFDFISTEQVMEHLAHPQETLKHLASGLKTGGLLKVSVPNGGNIHTLLKKMDWMAPKTSPDTLNAIAPLEHINCFNHRSIVIMAKAIGLELVQLPYVNPNQAIGQGVAAGLKGWIRANLALLKKLFRPFVHKLFFPNSQYRKGTRLYFRKK